MRRFFVEELAFVYECLGVFSMEQVWLARWYMERIKTCTEYYIGDRSIRNQFFLEQLEYDCITDRWVTRTECWLSGKACGCAASHLSNNE
jgi:hypothetical protein